MTGRNSLLTETPEPASEPRRAARLWRRIQSIVFILFCLEIGIVLLLFPWSTMWSRNYFFALAPQWSAVFSSNYLRGAISGVGVVNLWIAISEAWRLRGA